MTHRTALATRSLPNVRARIRPRGSCPQETKALASRQVVRSQARPSWRPPTSSRAPRRLSHVISLFLHAIAPTPWPRPPETGASQSYSVEHRRSELAGVPPPTSVRICLPFVSRHLRERGLRLCLGGSGSGLSKEPMSGVRSVVPECRVVPECPPGTPASRSFWSSRICA
jgi:hypothetical protein